MNPPPADRDTLLREMAANRGCKLIKSRRRVPGAGDYGRYGLKDAASEREIFGFGPDGLTATSEDIEGFLRKGAAADWKSSLAAAASAAANDERVPVSRAKARATRRTAAEPAPEKPKARLRIVEAEDPAPPPHPRRPAPPPPAPAPRRILKIREARLADANGIAALADLRGKALAARLAGLRKAGAPPLVAEEDGEILGVAAFQAIPLLHSEAPLGRVTWLLVATHARRRGLGRALLEEAQARLADLGCTRMEAMAEIELSAAPDFFRSLGWRRSASRYERRREEDGPGGTGGRSR